MMYQKTKVPRKPIRKTTGQDYVRDSIDRLVEITNNISEMIQVIKDVNHNQNTWEIKRLQDIKGSVEYEIKMLEGD